jgi:hypothetical protein
METFTKAKKMSGGDKTEVDAAGFKWAINRLTQIINEPIGTFEDGFIFLNVSFCSLDFAREFGNLRHAQF